MPKPFMTYEQQLTKLKDEKHILIPDEAKAKAKLQEIGYYSLVTGYKHIFRVPGQKIYKISIQAIICIPRGWQSHPLVFDCLSYSVSSYPSLP